MWPTKDLILSIASKLAKYDGQDKMTLHLNDISCFYTESPTTLDISFLITLFLQRGNSVAKILMTSSEEVKNVVSRKCAGIGISTAKPVAGTKLSPTTVTLARLSQAFPQVTATIILGKEVQGKLNPCWLLGSTLHLLMQHSIYAAVIPLDQPYTPQLQLIAIALNLEMTVMLHVPKEKRKMENRDLSDLEESSSKYVLAAMNGTTCTTAIQIRIMTKAGIIDASGVLSQAVILIHAACNNFLSMRDKSYKEAVTSMVSRAAAGANF